MATQQTVVVTQPLNMAPIPQQIRPWSTGICSCMEDCSGCCFGLFCYPCMVNNIAKKLNENCCVPLCCQGGPLMTRAVVRTMYGIQGTFCEDYFVTCCIPGLSMCQIDRELKRMGLE